MGQTALSAQPPPRAFGSLCRKRALLGEREQQKAIDFADAWLKEQPDNALLLMYLGRLAYGRKLWGKAKATLKRALH